MHNEELNVLCRYRVVERRERRQDVLGTWVYQAELDDQSLWVCPQTKCSAVSSRSSRHGPSTAQYQSAAAGPSLAAVDHLPTCLTTLCSCSQPSPNTVYAVSSLWSDCWHVELVQQVFADGYHQDQLAPDVVHCWHRCSNTRDYNQQTCTCMMHCITSDIYYWSCLHICICAFKLLSSYSAIRYKCGIKLVSVCCKETEECY